MSRFVINRSTNDQYYWVFKASNGEVICTSETYTRKENAKHSIEVMKEDADSASVVDMTE
jgi:hypothetical protein